MILIGIDLSLTSPGIACFNTNTHKWHMYAFLQHKQKHRLFKHEAITLWPQIPGPEVVDNLRFEHIITHIIAMIQMLKSESSVSVCLEDYAYDTNSGNDFKIYELAGILKYHLYTKCGITSVPKIAIGRWKKLSCDYGHATKSDVVTFMCTHGPKLDFLTLLDQKVGADDKIPSPTQDLCDSAGIVLALLYLIEHPAEKLNPAKKKNKKSKKDKKTEKDIVAKPEKLKPCKKKPKKIECTDFDYSVLFDQ